jgi:hypothetical protein
MSEHTQHHSGSIDRLTDALVHWACSGTQIVNHMRRHFTRGGDPIPVVLNGLIAGTLAPVADRHAESDLAAAVTVIEDALDTLAEEILLVEPAAGEPEV